MAAEEWLHQAGPYSPKHLEGWAHPVIAFLLHYAIVLPSVIIMHDIMVEGLNELSSISFSRCPAGSSSYSTNPFMSESDVSNGFAIYILFTFVYRLTLRTTSGSLHKRAVIYEFTWLCNSTMIFISIGLRTCRPILALSFCVSVSVDQLLWWVDLIGWAGRWENQTCNHFSVRNETCSTHFF